MRFFILGAIVFFGILAEGGMAKQCEFLSTPLGRSGVQIAATDPKIEIVSGVYDSTSVVVLARQRGEYPTFKQLRTVEERPAYLIAFNTETGKALGQVPVPDVKYTDYWYQPIQQTLFLNIFLATHPKKEVIASGGITYEIDLKRQEIDEDHFPRNSYEFIDIVAKNGAPETYKVVETDLSLEGTIKDPTFKAAVIKVMNPETANEASLATIHADAKILQTLQYKPYDLAIGDHLVALQGAGVVLVYDISLAEARLLATIETAQDYPCFKKSVLHLDKDLLILDGEKGIISYDLKSGKAKPGLILPSGRILKRSSQDISPNDIAIDIHSQIIAIATKNIWTINSKGVLEIIFIAEEASFCMGLQANLDSENIPKFFSGFSTLTKARSFYPHELNFY